MIYFDNAATTPVLKEALNTFARISETNFGNSESNHAFGREASKILENARSHMLSLFGVSSSHSLLFTSCATESNNLAIKGIALRYQKRGKRIITTRVEHPSVLQPIEELKNLFGFEVDYLDVDKKGIVSPEELKSKMGNDVILVSIMAVNNELGTLNPIADLAKVVRLYPKAIFHVDATQAIGKVDLPYKDLDLVSFSAHKFGGLKGTGGLLFKKSLSFVPINAGGGQEQGFRAGTVNVAGMAAMDEALSVSLAKQKEAQASTEKIYAYLYSFLSSLKDEVSLNSLPLGEGQTSFVLNFSLFKRKASVVVEALSNEGIFVSSVSACSSKEEKSSYVIYDLTKDKDKAENSIRLSFSFNNTMEEAKTFASVFAKVLNEVNPR